MSFEEAQDPIISGAIFNENVRCLKCGRWCRSWHGFRIHFGKRHIKHPIRPKPKPKRLKPKPKPMTLWDLRYGGKRLELCRYDSVKS